MEKESEKNASSLPLNSLYHFRQKHPRTCVCSPRSRLLASGLEDMNVVSRLPSYFVVKNIDGEWSKLYNN